MTITVFKPAANELSEQAQSMVDHLHEALERVRAGETKQLLLIEDKGTTLLFNHGWIENRFSLIGQLQHAIHKLLNEE